MYWISHSFLEFAIWLGKTSYQKLHTKTILPRIPPTCSQSLRRTNRPATQTASIQSLRCAYGSRTNVAVAGATSNLPATSPRD